MSASTADREEAILMSYPLTPELPQPEVVQPPTSVPAPATNSPATASLVLGIVSIVASVLFLPAIAGFVLGLIGLHRSGRTHPPVGRRKAVAGLVLSVVGFVLGVVLVAAIASSTPQGRAESVLDDVARSAESAESVEDVDEPASGADPAEADAAPVYDIEDFVPVDAAAWDAVAKNPDGAEGDTVIVFAEVTQFDAATGTDTLRANVGVSQPAGEFELETNTVVTGDEALLAGVVAGDVLKLHAVVAGSYEYATQIGGSTVVPLLAVAKVEAVGFADLTKDVVLGAPARDEFGYLSIPVTITNSGAAPFTYSVNIVAESADGSTSYGSAGAFAENLAPGQRIDATADFFEEIPDGAVFRVAEADRYGS